MRETLLIRLAGDEGATWRIAGSGESEPSSDSGSLEQAIAECEGRRVVLLVPGTSVVLCAAHLPGLRGQKLRQALPFALEDDLAEDVDALHFAFGASTSEGDHFAAVAARRDMDAWLAPFADAGVAPDAVYPETLAVPWSDGDTPRWTVLLDGEHVLVRTGSQSGFACEAAMLADVVALSPLPDNLEVAFHARRQEQDRADELCGCFDGASVEKKGYWHTLASLADGLDGHAIDLRQGDYALSRGWQRWSRPFRATAVLLVVLFVVHMGTLGARYLHLSHQQARLQSHTRETYKTLFPGDTRIEDIRAQTQAHLAALRQGGGRNTGLFFLLGRTAHALQATPALRVRSMQYQNNALSISLQGSDLGDLAALRKQFSTQSGVALEVQSANSGSNGVRIRLRITVASG